MFIIFQISIFCLYLELVLEHKKTTPEDGKILNKTKYGAAINSSIFSCDNEHNTEVKSMFSEDVYESFFCSVGVVDMYSKESQ